MDEEMGTDMADASTSNKHHSLSDDHLHTHSLRVQQTTVTKFSDVPPVLVDSHPTALNATSALNMLSLTMRGPPPKPPPRDYTGKGHGRSASLDLKTFNSLSSSNPPVPPMSAYHAERIPSEPTQPFSPLAVPRPMTTTSFHESHFTPIRDESNTVEMTNSFNTKMQLASPREVHSVAVQTEDELAAFDVVQAAQEALSISSLDALPGVERCSVLRKLNAQLENERITLAQIRLQLQLRIDEAESLNAAATAPTIAKPTVL
jgi:hypothetical protein